MPMYRFSSIGKDEENAVSREFGFFNDDGALSYARRIQGQTPVEVWQQDRLVARLDPKLMSN